MHNCVSLIKNNSRVNASEVGLITCGAFMGSPIILCEKMLAGNETRLALEALQRLLASGVYDSATGEGGWEEGGRRGSEDVRVREKDLGGGKKAWIAEPDDLKKVDISDPTKINLVSNYSPEIRKPKNFSAVFSHEGSPTSSVPRLEGPTRLSHSSWGRSLASLCWMQMGWDEHSPSSRCTAPSSTAVGPTPALWQTTREMWLPVHMSRVPRNWRISLESNVCAWGECVCAWGECECVCVGNVHACVCVATFTPIHTNFFLYRMSCGICLGVLTLQDVLNKAVLLSMSMAWQLGRAVKRAQVNHSDVLEAIATQQNGNILIVGKVRTLLVFLIIHIYVEDRFKTFGPF